MTIYENIRGFVPTSLVDWDGKVASVIFLAGCNFRCRFCHNKELVLGSEQLKVIPFPEIKDYLGKNKDFIDGVVITGGEPCLNDDLPELCREIKKIGFKVRIETNGTNPEMLKELLKGNFIDCIAMDIKTSFGKYKQIVDVNADIEKIKESIAIVREFPDYEFRITMFPEIKKEDLLEIADYLKNAGANKAFFIQQFRNENCMDDGAEKIKPYDKEELEGFLEAVKKYFVKAGIRNL